MKIPAGSGPQLLIFFLSTMLAHSQGASTRSSKMEISTDIYAHYAMTTVEATFETGDDEGKEVTFDFTVPENAFVTGLDIVVNNITCTATIEELKVAEDIYNSATLDGSTAIKVETFDDEDKTYKKQRIETKVTIESNAVGKFVLTYEESVERPSGDVTQPYSFAVPLETKEIYDTLSVTCNVQVKLLLLDFQKLLVISMKIISM